MCDVGNAKSILRTYECFPRNDFACSLFQLQVSIVDMFGVSIDNGSQF